MRSYGAGSMQSAASLAVTPVGYQHGMVVKLGTPYCRRPHHGRIDVDSKAGQGTESVVGSPRATENRRASCLWSWLQVLRATLRGCLLASGPAASRGQAACPFLSDDDFSGDGAAGESVFLVVASGSATTVISTSAPRFKLTVSPSPFCKTLSILIS